ncbi:LOW QUALITY PROTEIN: Hypothetical protein PHPALM_10900 [Phytophthora palmivora]|uniref:Tc1-like transposase DDE domain-containing protein n=1 Tax=Phytophthora palmivora TaxID=4796 RepID=A0A2P4Y3I4_9STRA|nr:LOW QUALITY PROTEIN: Hypothetical protein PHPALM_10900 [Phytophthora palmivora]
MGISSCITMRPISTCNPRTRQKRRASHRSVAAVQGCKPSGAVSCVHGDGASALPPAARQHSHACECFIVDEIYDKFKSLSVFQEHFIGKKVVLVLDNAPAHNQTEDLITDRDDLVLLRLTYYSPMCNPIEGKQYLWYFSVLKAKIKADFPLSREELVMTRPRGTIAAARMDSASKRCIGCMDMRLVNRIAMHCQHAVAAAENLEDMEYGI